ncbi:alpha/beta hydrolase [Mucilaginibacter ginsenosidivorans]|uniref:Alpha/beta hydrolase n=1 Tax=Mucilaginibacter ginsenosidivorans TaxID=398053 RepID=A0A5B8UQC1_9SPHI|nr:alpha/beta hydrolase [Mucilaginibacter ginsenosidivorans]QEC61313.1 alpha/beta hydrolase [Mucilaginibacter ginsenosidivorans]
MTRLIILIILLLLSLLAVLRAQAYYLWLMAIAVSEFPLIFAGGTVIMLATGFWAGKYQLAGTVVGIIALILFLSPIFRSYLISRHLQQDMRAAFGPAGLKKDAVPFSFGKLFRLKFKDTIGSKTLTYVTYGDGTAMKFDFFPAQVPGQRPCVIVVHGGSWSSGDSKQLADLNSLLAQKGYNVAAINYRLAPKYQTPAPVEDIKNAMSFFRTHADEFHIDTSQFVLLGRSAGAQIALLAAYTLHDKSIKGVIEFYGPVDMVWGYSIPSNPLIMDSRKVMGDYVGGPYDKVPQKYHDCSPLFFTGEDSPPTLMIHGVNDVLVTYLHAVKLSAKLQEDHVKHYWLKLPWATHGFDFNLYGPGGQLSTYAVGNFLSTVTK